MLGWIMPEPLEMPPAVTVLPLISTCTACSFLTVSVVMIALAASSEPAALSLKEAIRASMPSSTAAMLSSCPITPVEPVRTRSASMPKASAAHFCIFFALSMSLGAHALALPELAIIAIAFPLFTVSISSCTGAALTLLRVNSPAAAQSHSETIRARSFFVFPFLIPALMPPALNPFAAVTPPSIIFTMSFSDDKTFRLINAKHDIHILDGSSGRPFAEVVKNCA